MGFLVYIFMISVVYIVTFKTDFKEENIAKVSPLLFVLGAVILLMVLYSAFMGGK